MKTPIFKSRALTAVGLLFAVLLVAAGAGLWYSRGDSSAAPAVTIPTGGGKAPVAVAVFGAPNVTINAGDSVIWTNSYVEPHTVSFLNNAPPPAGFDPAAAIGVMSTFAVYSGGFQLSSGFIEEGGQYTVEFTNPGKYHYICLIHPGMEADVTVQAPNSPGATTQADVNTQAAARIPPALASGQAALASLPKATSTTKADGTTTWTMGTGASVPVTGGTADVLVFNAPSLTIKTGDTVTWSAGSVPHTVTFNPDQFNLPSPFVPAARPTFDGTGLVNGVVSTNPQFAATSTFSLTFTKPGTYPYICLLHVDQGMAGVIVVSGTGVSTGGLGAPNTGDAGLASPSDGGTNLAWALTLLAATLVAAGGFWRLARNRR